MKVGIAIDDTKELLKGPITALGKEVLKRLQNRNDEFSLVIRIEVSDGFCLYGDERGAKKREDDILQKTLESAGD